MRFLCLSVGSNAGAYLGEARHCFKASVSNKFDKWNVNMLRVQRTVALNGNPAWHTKSSRNVLSFCLETRAVSTIS
jgi:hypothetical protein